MLNEKPLTQDRPGMEEPAGFKEKFAVLSQKLQAYLTAFNEVAIVSVTDLEGTILYVNDQFTEISKYTREEIIGQSHRVINSQHHSKEFFKEMWQTISSGKVWRGEIKNKAKDGSYYWVNTAITPVKDNNGKPVQYVSIRTVITAQKENEEQLASYQKNLLRQKQQLKEAQEVAKTGSWVLDVTAGTIEGSEETYRIFEIPADTAMTYELFLEHVHPDDRNRIEDNWNKALKTGFYETEHRIITASGEKWVRERARFDFTSAAELHSTLGTVQDITDKKKTEQALKKTAAEYMQLFNNSPYASGIVDKQSMRFLKVNNTATALYGYTESEFLTLTPYEIRMQEDHEQLACVLKKGEYTLEREVRPHRKKNGEIILTEPIVTEINYHGQEVFLISIKDVTEQTRIEQELALEKYNRQLEVDRAALQAEEKSRTETGRELHDNINQLLVAATLFLKNSKAATEKDEEMLQKGVSIVHKAIEEIRKLSSVFVPPPLQDISFKDAVECLTQGLKLSGTSVNIDIDFPEEQFEEAFKLNMYRIIQEQFNNIVKYAEATKVNLLLIQEEKILTLDIRDNGKGFDPVKKPRGLGLANIRHRARLYQGNYKIESSTGKGCRSVIRFSIPEKRS